MRFGLILMGPSAMARSCMSVMGSDSDHNDKQGGCHDVHGVFEHGGEYYVKVMRDDELDRALALE